MGLVVVLAVLFVLYLCIDGSLSDFADGFLLAVLSCIVFTMSGYFAIQLLLALAK